MNMPRATPSSPSQPSPPDDLDEILQALQRGLGHDRVTESNVAQLIDGAARKGDRQTELLLREWRSTCGEDPDMPTLPPNLPPR